jgi:hypothetical protein
MPKQLGPIEVTCDAPIFPIVQSCEKLGMHAPADVRWCRMSHFLNGRGGWRDLLRRKPWELLFEMRSLEEKRCFCAEHLPSLSLYTFTFSTGKEVSYFLGQCQRCQTVFWEEA